MTYTALLITGVTHFFLALQAVDAQIYSVDAGSGTIQSPNFPHWYPNLQRIEWQIESPANTHIRIRFLHFILEESENCVADALSVYDGIGESHPLGLFCGSGLPSMLESSSSFMTIRFVSDFQEQNEGFVLTYEVVDDILGSRVVWTEMHPETETVRLSSLSADPLDMLTHEGTLKSSVSTEFYYQVSRGSWGAVGINYGQQHIIWSDKGRKRIISGTIGRNAQARSFFDGTSDSVNGIAVDWLTGNVYWTDAVYDWILLRNSDGSRYDIVIDEGLDQPGGIAVHPFRGFLFWTDAGVEPKIERSDLAGGNRIKLAATDVVSPRGIAVDYDTNLVYWVDSDTSGNRVEVCDILGFNRRQLYRTNTNEGFFDLTIFTNYIYISGVNTSTIHVLTKDTGQFVFSLNLPYRPYGIVTYAPDTQPPSVSHCSSNPCSYLCVGGGPNGFTCLCGSGRLLASDGRTCRDERAISPPQLFVASRTKLSRYPSNFPDVPIPDNYNISNMLINRHHAVALAVDLEDGLMFYSDVVSKAIGMASLRMGSPVRYITGATSSVEGMAVDWLTKHVYWTDNPRGTIEVSRYDGSYRTTLLKDKILRPRSIVIDPAEKVMFWTEFGPPCQIERASLDGTQRIAIIDEPQCSLHMSGLAIDYEEQRLYFGAISPGVIYSVDYDGGGMREVFSKPNSLFFELTLYKDYIMWTELGPNQGIFISNRETGKRVRAFAMGEPVYGITMYADTRQKVIHNPCRSYNGGCQQLCLNSKNHSNGYVCRCTMGYHLADNGRDCHSSLVQHDFLLVTDTYRRGIYQVDLNSNFKPEALRLNGVKNAIGVSFDPVETMVYWTDVEKQEINRAAIDGSWQETVAMENIGQPDGIAVDSISRLVYWTDLVMRSISVSTLDGSDRKTLVTNLVKPRAIVLHPVEGIMFWTDWRTSTVIERSYMDGDMRRVIIDTGLRWTNGLAIDFAENRLYWCDGGLDVIESSDFSGHDRRVVLIIGDGFHAFGISIIDQSVYWTDWGLRDMLKVDKETGLNKKVLGNSSFARPNALFAVTNDSLPSGINSCSENNGGCSTLCLPTAIGRTCACSDGVNLATDGVSCVSELDIQCPLDFIFGGVEESCDRSPGGNCSVICYSGLVPAVDYIICQRSGSWDIPRSAICREEECEALDVPDHAIFSGPCNPPYDEGKLCILECEPGYVRTSGKPRRVCAHGGEWIGTPIVCEERVEEPTEGECSRELAFRETPEDLSPVQNDLVQQSCSTNIPQADITWYKDGVRLMTGSVNGIYILPSNDLLIPGFDTHHQGHYSCIASFSGQECLRVDVNFAFDPYRHFEAVPSNASLEVGDHYLLECQAKSALDSVEWWKDGRRVSQTDQLILISGGSLLIRNLVSQDSGKYTCIVSDQRGNQRGEAHAWLIVADVILPTINITQVCGTVTSPEAIISTTMTPRGGRVVGGQQSLPGSAPYMGRIWHKTERSFVCGATLLNQRWVLTAAHCIVLYSLEFRDILLYFGDHDTMTTEDHQVVAEVDQIIQHEDFDEISFDKDVALIRLKQPFEEFTDYIRPICLPPAWLAKTLLQTDRMGRVTGWGQIAESGPYPRYLTEVELPVVRIKRCKEATTFEVTKFMFCAGYADVEEKKDACQGDSGGPFAMRHENRWYQLGIVSWGEGCARDSKYGYYTKILKFISWIERNISQ